MHFEAASYPKYVPIIKYEEFVFDVHCLDIMFIHNPYDNMNYNVSAPVFVREIITDSKYIYLIINMLTCWKEDWGIDSAKRAVEMGQHCHMIKV